MPLSLPTYDYIDCGRIHTPERICPPGAVVRPGGSEYTPRCLPRYYYPQHKISKHNLQPSPCRAGSGDDEARLTHNNKMGQAAGEKDDEAISDQGIYLVQQCPAECPAESPLQPSQPQSAAEIAETARPRNAQTCSLRACSVQKPPHQCADCIDQVPVELILYNMRTCSKTCVCLMH